MYLTGNPKATVELKNLNITAGICNVCENKIKLLSCQIESTLAKKKKKQLKTLNCLKTRLNIWGKSRHGSNDETCIHTKLKIN